MGIISVGEVGVGEIGDKFEMGIPRCLPYNKL